MNSHLEFAIRVADKLRRRQNLQVPAEDLYAYAQAGLVDAAERYDAARGIPFTTFAYYRIQGAILDGVRVMGWQPRQRHGVRFEAGANAYLEEVASEQPSGAEQVGEALTARSSSLAVIWLTALDGTETELADERSGALRKLERVQLAAYLHRALARLSPREQAVLEGMYYQGRSMAEMAQELQISIAWLSRLHRRAIDRLRLLVREGGLIT